MCQIDKWHRILARWVDSGILNGSSGIQPMTRLPSVNTLEEICDCREDAIAVRKIMEKERYLPFRMLGRVNNFLGLHGREYIASKQDTPWVSLGISYCNTGDSYAATLCYDHKSGRVFVSSWGDIVENNKRFG